ncbi:MAG: T9SS type A sorting domain-containing protein [Hymenobacteraceae bacterium]|nr:T9SS type A sorting domain-containing protein [Hymenobacteraceae bacterium]
MRITTFRVLLLAVVGALNLLPATAQGTAVAASPTFFRETEQVTITYDASKGNAALAGFSGPVYIWTGIVTNLSLNNTTWRHVKSSNFGQGDPAALMTRSATNPNLYTIRFTPRDFYPVPANETILRLGMIFKNADGSLVGRSDTGGDFFVDVWQGQYAVRITSPIATGAPQFVAAGATVTVSAEASQTSQLQVTLNGVTQGTSAAATSITQAVTVTNPGRNVVRVQATNGANSVADSIVFFVRPVVTTAPLPASVVAGLEDGVTYVSPTAAVLVLTAPQKQFVYALGEWNGFQPETAGFMNRTPDGNRWWVQINNLTAGQQYAYQFLVDGTLKVADPYAEVVLDPNSDNSIPATTYPNRKPYPTGQTTGIVSVLQTAQTPYVWQTTNYQRPKETDLVVYEMIVRDFVGARNYQTVRDTLDYLQRLGVTAIELMPVSEFENNDSWGYNPSFQMALDKAYGTREAYRQFIDECHARGIAVIMDVALNHQFGQSPMAQLYFDGSAPTASSPWFNRVAKHDFNVGYDLNHESPFTKYWAKRVMRYWLENFKIDGYRFDLSKGFTQKNTLGNTGAWGQYDASRIAIWKDYADHLWNVDSTCYVILEHFAENREERELAEHGRGMMPWGNAHFAMVEVAKGFVGNSDFSYGLSHVARGMTRPRLMGYAESHDEERLMVESLTNGNRVQAANGYDVRTLPIALARQGLVAAFLLAVPGPKMLYEFDELGYDVSINVNGRTGAKPVRWNYYQDANRRRLYETYRAMNRLRQHPSFETTTYAIVNPGSSLRTVRVVGPGMSTMVIGNIAVIAQTMTPTFPQGGKWYDYLRGDSVDVTANPSFHLAAGEYRVLTTVRQALPAGSTLLGLADEASLTDRAGFTAPRVYPNPTVSGQALSIAYELARPATVQAVVYDLLGRVVAALPAARQDAGFQSLQWQPGVAPGTYTVRVQADGGPARPVRVVVR